MESTREIGNILTDYVTGDYSADECFCMILSLVGFDACKSCFRKHVEGVRKQNPRLHNQLINVYRAYFEDHDNQFNLPDKIDCAVENGYYANDSDIQNDDDAGFMLDIDLAIKLSMMDEHIDSTPTNSYASVANKLKQPSKEIAPNIRKIQSSINQPSKDMKSHSSIEVITKPASKLNSSDNISLQQSDTSGKRKKKRNKKKPGIEHPLSNPPVLYWFRRDLRLYDNPALVAASNSGAPVIPLFLWSDKLEESSHVYATGGATKYWLHMALPKLSEDMVDKFNNPIIYRKSNNYLNELLSIAQYSGARTLIINDVYEPHLKERDDKIFKVLQSRGVKCQRFHSYLLHHPGSIRTESLCMRGIGSVTHFMECCRQSSPDPLGLPVDPPACLPVSDMRPESDPLEDLGLGRLPRRKDGTIIDWAKTIRESWDFSENGAWEALQIFLNDGIKCYEKESSRGDKPNTSKISPYLHFGQISPRTVLNEGRHLKSPKFLRKLAWRDLSYWLLSVFPDLPYAPTRPQYEMQHWSNNKAHLKAWQKGNTGYPLVDAAMRHLWLTGWMNNYMRHVVASFLISYLHLSWIEGYKWFQDTLLDADVAINAMMWQNGGMSGLDQWNFVMHPVDSAMTCDPKGDYVRQWVPELSALPEEFIHKPWKCPPSIVKRAGVTLGVTYPHRIITDLETAREQSLKDVVKVRQTFNYLIDLRTGNDLLELPSGVVIPLITRKEFKYKTSNLESKDNPHSAVLRGYRSRKRDELVEFLNQRDFLSSTMKECSTQFERGSKSDSFVSFG